MELTVIHEEKSIGLCRVEDLGLYWDIACRCRRLSDRVERLYCGTRSLGVLEREGEALRLHRRVSKASLPDFPPENGKLSLLPLWQGRIFDCTLPAGQLLDGKVWYPASPDREFPCMPLFCFFHMEQRQGRRYWTIPIEIEKNILKSY